MTKNFYESLIPYTDFRQLTDGKHFQDVPDDWYVIITDIKGSTKAISEGRYKDVNTIGAAGIVVVRRAMMMADFPFVFGGDGATLIVPEKDVHRVCENLAALRQLSQDQYQLDLRIGVVPVKKILEAGKSVKVGKYQITEGRCIAILKGNGLIWAEKEIKGSDQYLYNKKVVIEPDLRGLSCRWNPIPSRQGKILTLIVSSHTDNEAYEVFFNLLGKIFPDGIESANPVNVDLASYKSVSNLIKDERKLHRSIFSPGFILRALEIFVAVAIFKYNIRPLIFNSEKYAKSMRGHSDFRKFDDVLRMVIDCNSEQRKLILEHLQNEHSLKKLCYGVHESDHSLMTCYVDGLDQGQHIHFIDAENGGYALAAVQLKQQLAERKL